MLDNPTPGQVVLYRNVFTNDPWQPAVVFTEELAPIHVRSTRPNGFLQTLVLLFPTPDCQFKWAGPNDLRAFELCAGVSQCGAIATEKLEEAYAMADSALMSDLDMAHWASEVNTQSAYSTAFTSLSNSNIGSLTIYDSSDDENPLYALPKAQTSGSAASRDKGTTHGFKRSSPSSSSNRPNKRRNSPSKDQSSSSGSPFTASATNTGDRPFMPAESAVDKFLGMDRLGSMVQPPESDVVGGDISASRDYVSVFIGSEHHERVLPLARVWKRPYFRTNTGVMHFEKDEDNKWVLKHNMFAEMSLEESQLVLEFFESDDFGHRYLISHEQRIEACEQILSAWDIANKNNMTDLLDLIITKTSDLIDNWTDLLAILLLACRFFETEMILDPDHEARLKKKFFETMAEHFHDYIHDDELHSELHEAFRAHRELEIGILSERLRIMHDRPAAETGENEDAATENRNFFNNSELLKQVQLSVECLLF